MHNLADSDKELVERLIRRLQIKDKAISDLTVMTKKLEALNNKLLDSEKVKTQFLSNIRNEVNNPLSSVMGLSKIIASSEELPNPDIKSIGNSIYQEAFDLNFQMQNIFAAAELEAGEALLSISNVDIKLLIQHIVDSFQHRACEKKLTITFGLRDDLKDNPFFRTDPQKLQIIMSNLMANAIEYSFEEGLIIMNVWKDGDRLNISLKDNGIGIDENDHATIFDRFKQLDAGLTKSHRGHGLGLSIVKALVEVLNGKVSVISRKGCGSIFALDIPEAGSKTAVDTFSDDGNDFFFEGNDKFRRF